VRGNISIFSQLPFFKGRFEGQNLLKDKLLVKSKLVPFFRAWHGLQAMAIDVSSGE
jgi:hypothetical protein